MTHPEQTAAHTPGPWSLPHFAEPGVNCQCGYVLTNGMMGAICTVYASGAGDDWAKHGDNPSFQEAVANARLIAAAPDLLEAGRSMIAAFDPDAMNPEQFNAWSDLSAAISRAEGRTEPKAGA